MSSRDVTTIIPVFNCARFLPDALASVLAQSEGEVIVVDDGSQDSVESAVRAFPQVRLLRHSENRGPAAARNTGLHATSSTWVAFLDADDVWTENKLRVQLQHFAEQPTLEVVVGRLRYWHTPAQPGDAEAHAVYSFGSGLFRRSAFAKIGAVDESLRYGEDTDWFLKAREQKLPMLFHDDVVQLYRRHDQNMTSQRSAAAKADDLFGALRRSLKRRASGSADAELAELSRMPARNPDSSKDS